MKLLQKYDINMLVFISENKENRSIVLTPVLNNHSKCNSSTLFGKSQLSGKQLSQISIVSNFKDIVSLIQAPEKQLHTPNLKKQIFVTDKFKELSKLYQWFKEVLRDVEMVILNIEGRKYMIAQECAEFLNVREIREKFQQILEINKAIGLPENHQVFKLFFVLFSQFMQREIKG